MITLTRYSYFASSQEQPPTIRMKSISYLQKSNNLSPTDNLQFEKWFDFDHRFLQVQQVSFDAGDAISLDNKASNTIFATLEAPKCTALMFEPTCDKEMAINKFNDA